MKSKQKQWVAVGVAVAVILIFVIYTYARNNLFSQLPTNINQTVTDETASTTSPAGELQVKDLVVGTGETAQTGDTVTVNYIGTFPDGTKFDSSYDHGQTFSFVLGGGQVIPGWDLGVVGMKVGGKRQLIIPPNLGYGSQPVGPIPGNSTLVFEVDLVSVEHSASQ